MADFGKVLVVMGAVIVVAGIVFMFAGRLPLLGRLPGDIVVRRDNFSFYFPIATSIVISLLLTVLLNIIVRRLH